MEHKGEFAMGLIGLILAGVGGLILGTGLMFRMAANRMMSFTIESMVMMIMISDGDSSIIMMMAFSLFFSMGRGQRMLNISTVIIAIGSLCLITGAILAIVGWVRYIQLEHGGKI